MSTTETEDKLANARAQAKAQYESICEMVAVLLQARDDDAYEAATEELARAAGYVVSSDTYEDREVFFWHKASDSRVSFDDTVHTDCQDEESAWQDCCEDNNLRPDEDKAREAIEQDALSVEVRSDWHIPGGDNAPAEFNILLYTGGPAVRILGELDESGEPTRAWLQCQDWFTSWVDYLSDVDGDILLDYARCFYFSEG